MNVYDKVMVKKALVSARALIEDPKHWTQGANATDSSGKITMPNSPNACCFCANGAILKVCEGFLPISCVIPFLERGLPKDKELNQSLFVYNDTHTHSEVLKLFDQAIAKL
jgi:hypothetical protein